jgi:hypothetical protein
MVEGVRALLHDEKTAKVNLTKGRHARRRAGELFIEEEVPRATGAKAAKVQTREAQL